MSRRATGLRAWALQRFSAMIIVVWLFVLIGYFLVSPPGNHAAWLEWMSSPFATLGTALFSLSIVTHAWVGMRDILIDYIKPLPVRLGLLSLIGLVLLVCALSALGILVRIS